MEAKIQNNKFAQKLIHFALKRFPPLPVPLTNLNANFIQTLFLFFFTSSLSMEFPRSWIQIRVEKNLLSSCQ